ncbi:hypothetical protein IEQ34_015629 [Dendrobium chrysotoxum]|uniref:Uncharacterized protein n=1 Tax=Dendrobium chrysotoxum TaxID=161865 RepID=A0AAV7GJF1_DENCH|nr:hypothetical protein IEQ34_015629 [Dendrobium chrysotoxum]
MVSHPSCKSSWAFGKRTAGWYSSQNTYLLLSLHNDDNGVHVSVGLILATLQHGSFEFEKPATKPYMGSSLDTHWVPTLYAGGLHPPTPIHGDFRDVVPTHTHPLSMLFERSPPQTDGIETCCHLL